MHLIVQILNFRTLLKPSSLVTKLWLRSPFQRENFPAVFDCARSLSTGLSALSEHFRRIAIWTFISERGCSVTNHERYVF